MHVVPNDGQAKPSKSSRTSFVIPGEWSEYVNEEAARLGASKSSIYMQALAEYRAARTDGEGLSAWDTIEDDKGYDPHHFYTHSQDKKGHSFHLRVNFPKPLAGAIGALIQTGIIPQYRTIEDFARDAIYHRSKQIALAIDDEDLDRTVDMAMMLADELHLIAIQDEAESFIAAVKTNAARLWEQGERAGLRKYLVDREPFVDSIPSPFSGELKDVIAEYRGRLNKGRRRR